MPRIEKSVQIYKVPQFQNMIPMPTIQTIVGLKFNYQLQNCKNNSEGEVSRVLCVCIIAL